MSDSNAAFPNSPAVVCSCGLCGRFNKQTLLVRCHDVIEIFQIPLTRHHRENVIGILPLREHQTSRSTSGATHFGEIADETAARKVCQPATRELEKSVMTDECKSWANRTRSMPEFETQRESSGLPYIPASACAGIGHRRGREFSRRRSEMNQLRGGRTGALGGIFRGFDSTAHFFLFIDRPAIDRHLRFIPPPRAGRGLCRIAGHFLLTRPRRWLALNRGLLMVAHHRSKLQFQAALQFLALSKEFVKRLNPCAVTAVSGHRTSTLLTNFHRQHQVASTRHVDRSRSNNSLYSGIYLFRRPRISDLATQLEFPRIRTLALVRHRGTLEVHLGGGHE